MTDGNQASMDEVYEDRNLLVQLVARLAGQLGIRTGIGVDEKEPEWPVIYVDLPTGQVSWHVPRDELLISLGRYDSWDGHSTADKRVRIERFLSENDSRN